MTQDLETRQKLEQFFSGGVESLVRPRSESYYEDVMEEMQLENSSPRRSERALLMSAPLKKSSPVKLPSTISTTRGLSHASSSKVTGAFASAISTTRSTAAAQSSSTPQESCLGIGSVKAESAIPPAEQGGDILGGVLCTRGKDSTHHRGGTNSSGGPPTAVHLHSGGGSSSSTAPGAGKIWSNTTRSTTSVSHSTDILLAGSANSQSTAATQGGTRVSGGAQVHPAIAKSDSPAAQTQYSSIEMRNGSGRSATAAVDIAPEAEHKKIARWTASLSPGQQLAEAHQDQNDARPPGDNDTASGREPEQPTDRSASKRETLEIDSPPYLQQHRPNPSENHYPVVSSTVTGSPSTVAASVTTAVTAAATSAGTSLLDHMMAPLRGASTVPPGTSCADSAAAEREPVSTAAGCTGDGTGNGGLGEGASVASNARTSIGTMINQVARKMINHRVGFFTDILGNGSAVQAKPSPAFTGTTLSASNGTLSFMIHSQLFPLCLTSCRARAMIFEGSLMMTLQPLIGGLLRHAADLSMACVFGVASS
ncbi:unnamed protein product [Amoebophrya sp. A25]|nr:unnamed protein product [Amoebophrya sp. A25]|eukprot:GSA25T00022629001.1